MSYCPDCASKDREIARLSAEIDCGALCGKCLTCWQHSAVTMLERYKQASAENQRLQGEVGAGAEYIKRTDPIISCAAWLHGGEAVPKCGECRGCIMAERGQLSAQLAAQVQEIEGLRRAAKALVDQMRIVHDSPEFMGVFQMLMIRGGTYSGPQYASQFADLCAELDKATPSEQREEKP